MYRSILSVAIILVTAILLSACSNDYKIKDYDLVLGESYITGKVTIGQAIFNQPSYSAKEGFKLAVIKFSLSREGEKVTLKEFEFMEGGNISLLDSAGNVNEMSLIQTSYNGSEGSEENQSYDEVTFILIFSIPEAEEPRKLKIEDEEINLSDISFLQEETLSI